jgi:hypothetical protein
LNAGERSSPEREHWNVDGDHGLSAQPDLKTMQAFLDQLYVAES